MINLISNRYCNFIAKNVRHGPRTKLNMNRSPSYTMRTWRTSNASFKSFHSNSINSLLEAQYEKKYPGKTPFVIASQIGHFEHVDFFIRNHDAKETGMSVVEMINQEGKGFEIPMIGNYTCNHIDNLLFFFYFTHINIVI